MTIAAALEGVDRLVDTLDTAAAQVLQLEEPSADVAQLLTNTLDVPVRSGRLAASVMASWSPAGVVIAAGGPQAPYAPYVHAAKPFLTRTRDARVEQVAAAYVDHLESAVNHIQGA